MSPRLLTLRAPLLTDQDEKREEEMEKSEAKKKNTLVLVG